VFFWGIADRGRRVPMSLIADSKALLLAGIDDRGETIVVDFRPIVCSTQADEFGSTWLRESAAENHRQLNGHIVRLGAA
jgi:hypothetical protein